MYDFEDNIAPLVNTRAPRRSRNDQNQHRGEQRAKRHERHDRKQLLQRQRERELLT